VSANVTRSRIASLKRSTVAALAAVALLAPALHGLWTHQLTAADGAPAARAADASHLFGDSPEEICGACLGASQSRTALRSPAAAGVTARTPRPQLAVLAVTLLHSSFFRSSAPPRAPPLA